MYAKPKYYQIDIQNKTGALYVTGELPVMGKGFVSFQEYVDACDGECWSHEYEEVSRAVHDAFMHGLWMLKIESVKKIEGKYE